MRNKVYAFLVNKHAGIQTRYHKMHDNAGELKKIWSYVYLLLLNVGYYVFFLHFLGEKQETAIYEEKNLPTKQSESELCYEKQLRENEYIRCALEYDVISFDIFDTLIFRPFSEPTDLFYFVGNDLGFMDFKNIRCQAEYTARRKKFKECGHMEVNFEEIWNELGDMTGIDAKKGMESEHKYEYQFCYANPFMYKVYQELKKAGKKIIITSDMYLDKDFLEKILKKNGYDGYEKIFVSNEYAKSKAKGNLYEVVKEKIGIDKRILHIGDNPHSDVKKAKEQKIEAMHYRNVNTYSLMYRPYDMSAMIGGAYRGIINNKLYNGTESFSKTFEFGYVYGGLFVVGYCQFIHEYYEMHHLDKILFLSRDGDILIKAYQILFPEDNVEYVYWSRRAATQLTTDVNKYDYFRRFLYHKVNSGKKISEILSSMELESLCEMLPKSLSVEDILTDKNVKELKQVIENHWEVIQQVYAGKNEAAKKYYQAVLRDCKKVCAVDIGWAGSGAIALDTLVQKVWNIPCQVIGMIAGSNTCHNAEPDCSETFLQTGKMISYMYSSSHNRDLYKKHNLNKGYNIFWEVLLSSPTRQFKGFVLEEGTGEVKLEFGDCDKNIAGIMQIQEGIIEFVKEYQKHFEQVPFMYCISGRDAYAPMLLAAGNKEKYVKSVMKDFEIEIGVV